MKHKHTILRWFLIALALAGLLVSEVFLGIHIENNQTAIAWFIFSGLFVLLVAAIINLIAWRFMLKKLKTIKATKIFDELMTKRAEKQSGFLSLKRRFTKLFSLFYLYSILLLSATAIITAGFIALFSASDASMGGVLVFAFMQISFVFKFIPKPLGGKEFGLIPLSKQNFPLLYKAVSEAAQFSGVTANTVLFLGPDNNVSIYKAAGAYHIVMGVNIPRLLNYSELTSIMVHEFAHALNGDLKIKRLVHLLDSLSAGLLPFLFSISLANLLHFEWQMLEMAHSKMIEEKADSIMKDTRFAQSFVNASAKMAMLCDLYSLSLAQKNIFETEQAPENYYESLFALFLTEYETKKNVWHERCLKNLPPRYGTHPSFIERMKNLNVKDIAINFSQTTEEAEAAKNCFAEGDKKISNMQLYWANDREVQYLSPKKLIADYEKDHSSVSVYEAVNAYFSLIQYNNCLKLLNKILKQSPNNAFALFKKGIILASRFDDSCIDLFMNAVEKNPAYIEPVMPVLFMYLSYTGDQAKRESLYSWADEKANEELDLFRFARFAKAKDFTASDLPKETETAITTSLKEAGISALTIAKATLNAKAIYYAFVTASNSADNRAIDKAGVILDCQKEAFVLIPLLVNQKPRIYKAALKAGATLFLKSAEAIDKPRMKEIYRKRMKPSLSFWCISIFLISFLVGIMLVVAGGILSDEDFGNPESLYMPFFIAGGVVIILSILLLFTVAGINSIIISAKKKSNKPVGFTYELNKEISPEQQQQISEFLFLKGYNKQPSETIYRKFLSMDSSYGSFTIFGNIAINSENEKTIIRCYVEKKAYKQNKEVCKETGLNGMLLAFPKTALRKDLSVVLDILNVPENIKV